MSPSHRQSCDRCRQQKVRCLRDNDASVPGPGRGSASLLCDRCAKAGAECRYSEKQRGYRRRCSVRSSSEAGSTDIFDLAPAFGHIDATSTSSTAPSHVMTALMGHPYSDLHLDGTETTAGGFSGFDAPDAEHHLLSLEMPPASCESLATLLAEAVSASCMSAAPFCNNATAPAPLMETKPDHEDKRSLLFSQLTAVSERAMRTTCRLSRGSGTNSGATALMVSSPEVNEALEDTNTLISTVNDIMTAAATAGCDGSMTATDCAGLAFSALACHQNLMTLFRAICDAIKSRLQAKGEEREQQLYTAQNNSGVGPLNVAQFVMVLQLLMHLISRMGRILEISNTASEREGRFIAPAAVLDCSIVAIDDHAISNVPPGQPTASSATSVHQSTRRSGLLEHVQEIVGNIPGERERLRRIIQQLQAEMDHAEIH
ncbi:RNA polymerase II-specific transcription factor-like protein [Microdochium nivale]|nr:RNA polymerase II-specific transcription factor-like protein [Microdochium nivale]